MSIKSDRWIRRMAREHGMIEPFVDGQVREGRHLLRRLLLRLRHAGRARVPDLHQRALGHRGPQALRLTAASSSSTATSASCRPTALPWHARWSISGFPRNVLTICVGKSTYARCGIITNVTPFEPEWEGYVTLEISNTTPLPGQDLRQRGHLPGALLRGG